MTLHNYLAELIVLSRKKEKERVLALPVLEWDGNHLVPHTTCVGASTLNWTFFVLVVETQPPLPTSPQECRSRNKPPGIHESDTEVNSFEPLAFLRPFVSQQSPSGFLLSSSFTSSVPASSTTFYLTFPDSRYLQNQTPAPGVDLAEFRRTQESLSTYLPRTTHHKPAQPLLFTPNTFVRQCTSH